MSLVRRPNGKFVLLDSYDLDADDQRELMALTDDGNQIEAVLNVHPFHTVHCKSIKEMLPHARLIGTRRHHSEAAHLDWDTDLIEDEATQQQFSDTFDFSIPDGVDFIPEDESIHVSSVIVRHRESGIIHVDDTLMFLDVPALLEKFGPGPRLRFHPNLAGGLEKRAGAADDYIRWAKQLGQDWADTKIICAAHKGIMRLTDQTFSDIIDKALEHSMQTLDEHREKYG